MKICFTRYLFIRKDSSKCNFLSASLPDNFKPFENCLFIIGNQNFIELLLNLWMRGYKRPLQHIQVNSPIFNRVFDITQTKINQINLVIFVKHIGSRQVPMNYTFVINDTYLTHVPDKLAVQAFPRQR